MRKDVNVPLLKALIAKLLAASGVKAITSTRISPGKDNETVPYIEVCALPEIPIHGIGFDEPAGVHAKAQIACFTLTKREGYELAGEVSKALDGESLTVTGWGTSRMKGTGMPPTKFEVKGKVIYMTIRRITLLLANTDTT